MASVTRVPAINVHRPRPSQEANQPHGVFRAVAWGVHFLALAHLAKKTTNESEKDALIRQAQVLIRQVKEGKVTSFGTMHAAMSTKESSNDALYGDHFTKAGEALTKGGVKDLLFKATLGVGGLALACYAISKVSK